MRREDKEVILGSIDRLGSRAERLTPVQAEDVFLGVLGLLLRNDGYETSRTPARHDGGIDLLAFLHSDFGTYKLGVEFKYRDGRPIGVAEVRELLGAALLHEANRAILATNTSFSGAARELIERELPVKLELIDLDSLKTWVDRLEVEEARAEEALEILRTASRSLASLIARNPRALDFMEWRDIERLLAEVFASIGFEVELTPGSKDGGKDLILECRSKEGKRSYIVEAKHWRAGNKVGQGAVQEFLRVIVRESREGGLFLSTYGFTSNAFEQLTEFDRQRLRFGSESKIVALCQTYTKATSGIWSPPESLPEFLYEGTS